MKQHRGVVVGNVYQKYATRNPIARSLVNRFLLAFDRCVAETGAHTAIEVGCGEGELAFRLSRSGIRTLAFDIAPGLIAEAAETARDNQLPVEFRVADVYSFDFESHSEDLIVCCEVLEHLIEPERAIERLARAASRFVLMSVPREPVWRLLNLARIRYVCHLGNTPGHVQHWTQTEFLRLLERHFTIDRVESPLPWTMVLARTASPVYTPKEAEAQS